MYQVVLTLHSVVRWFLLVGLIYTIFISYRGWFQKRTFTSLDNAARNVTTILTHIQLLLGLWVYFISPITDYFMHNFKDAVHERDIRFLAMEHSLMMLISIIIITIGSMKAKRKKEDLDKFKTLAIWFSIALVVILFAIPWHF
jgi:amino acid permease